MIAYPRFEIRLSKICAGHVTYFALQLSKTCGIQEDFLKTAEILQIETEGVQKLEMQYRLRSYRASDFRVLHHFDVDSYLEQDKLRNWSF